MAAITSQTFHHSSALGLPRAAAEVMLAAGRLLKHVFVAAPAVAVRRTRAQEAEAVRALADRYVKTDPGYAADLYAAAARHEGQADR